MANYATLKTAIGQVVKTNGNNEITGALLQQSLFAMIESLGVGYQYMGVANPTTNPGTPDQNVFYFAFQSGTYVNMGGLVLDDEINIIRYNGTWVAESLGAATIEELAKKVDLIQTNIDPLQQTIRNYSILATGLYGSSTTYKHIIIPIDFQRVSFRANANNVCRYAWLTSNAAPVGGGQIPLVSGTSVMEIPASQFDSVAVPDGAEYLAVYIGAESTSYPFKPTEITIGSIVIDSLDSDSVKYALSARQGKILKGYCLDGETVDLSALSNGYGRIYNGLWNNTTRYCHVVFPVTKFTFLKITANQSFDATFAFLSSYTTPVNGANANLVSGTSPTTINAGAEITVQVPDGAEYVYLYGGDGSLGSSHIREHLPSDVYNFSTFRTALELAEKNEASIDGLNGEIDSIANRVNVKASFVGADTKQVGTQPIYNFAPGQTYRCVILNPNVQLADTSGSNYRFQLRAYDENGGTVETLVRYSTSQSLPEFVDFVVPDGTAYIRVLGRCVAGVEFPVIFFPIGGETIGTGNIINLNPDAEFIPKLLSAKKRYYTSTITNAPVPLTIGHITDIHANWVNVQRFIDWCNHHNAYIDIWLNTGDTVSNMFTDGIAGYAALTDVGKIWNVVGNHDTRGENGWQDYIGLPVYNQQFAPYISGWGVVQPANAAENGYCYYYKDFATQSLRIVVVDIMGFDATQSSWLATVLEDARTNNYHVLIATHFAGSRPEAESNLPAYDEIECNYTSLYPTGSGVSQLIGYNANSYLLNDVVNDFIVAGGKFVGFVQGHYHRSFVAKVDKYPNQLVYSGPATKAGELRDFNHVVGTRDQDEFTIMSIDTYQNIVKIYKVGANVDVFGRHINSVCVDYLTGEIKAQGF